ncbi:hypothetical protein NECAME_04981 [Necator americanus]|uniref:Uncharacterized protein n=1 Tax=Necator americanus TaxID=51031 RepID=W2SL16_NECAM|nr:hypothetical protein NECAME_04981 [Necator americanus]ETN70290.1 hypothetical protein NECAME_04981 [Necator americanus]
MQLLFSISTITLAASVSALNTFVDDTALIRHKRQTYYLCGIYPNQYYSSRRFCPSGQLSEVRCSNRGQCQAGQTCMTGLCCTTTGNEWNEACGGLAALSSCTNGMCSAGVCTASNYCCECPVGRSAGRCNAGICPGGFTCTNGFCCPQCPNNVMPFGACRNGVCGGGKTCSAGNICC